MTEAVVKSNSPKVLSREAKNTFQSISHKAFCALQARYGFVLPHHFETQFNLIATQIGAEMGMFSIEDDLKETLTQIEIQSNQNNLNLDLLANYSAEALGAMKRESKSELESIIVKTQDLVAHIKDLEQKAYFDDITGLLNRVGFKKHTCKEDKFCIEGVLFFIDLDGFKRINDTHGHKIGNSALKAFSELMKNALVNVPSNQKWLSRAGGDEFLIAVRQDNADYALKQISAAQQKNYCATIGNVKESLGFSYGVAVISGGVSFEEVVSKADALMYKNKQERKAGR